MNQYTLIARKNIENQYDSECSIYELKPKIVNNITKDVETEVFKNKKWYNRTILCTKESWCEWNRKSLHL